MGTRYEVVGPIAIAKQADGSDVYVREGEVVPEETTSDHVEHLINMGLIRPVAEASDKPAKKAAAKKSSSKR